MVWRFSVPRMNTLDCLPGRRWRHLQAAVRASSSGSVRAVRGSIAAVDHVHVAHQFVGAVSLRVAVTTVSLQGGTGPGGRGGTARAAAGAGAKHGSLSLEEQMNTRPASPPAKWASRPCARRTATSLAVIRGWRKDVPSPSQVRCFSGPSGFSRMKSGGREHRLRLPLRGQRRLACVQRARGTCAAGILLPLNCGMRTTPRAPTL
jgi:hypothetical protein